MLLDVTSCGQNLNDAVFALVLLDKECNFHKPKEVEIGGIFSGANIPILPLGTKNSFEGCQLG